MSWQNPFADISVNEVATKLAGQEDFILLDVRENIEREYARFHDPRLVILPMSRLAHQGIDALPENFLNKDKQIIVFCHHGVHSMQVGGWLRSNGWQNVFNMQGGIDAYASFVDPDIGFY